jgi:hypothetical protein
VDFHSTYAQKCVTTNVVTIIVLQAVDVTGAVKVSEAIVIALEFVNYRYYKSCLALLRLC